ncbi:MAG: multicopper oxidase domain-containing protein [Nitrospinae bacterium]|nr:multicopper oxidase domain-containing protein [Nitrospinota bacterium]
MRRWLPAFAAGFVILAATPAARAETREFRMTIEQTTITVAPDLDYAVFGYNGQTPGPLIHVRQGDDVVVHVTNNTLMPHTIHWHGVYQTDNWRLDGVPGVTQEEIRPAGGTFTYRWKAEKSGSLWYHCHVNVSEHVAIRGMWGPIVVDPLTPTPEEKRVTKEALFMLSTWDSHFAGMWGQGGAPHDMPDYFSVNAKCFPITHPLRVKKGDVVRFRFFAVGMSIHTLHLHGHDMLVTHKDGTPLPQPYWVDTLMIGPGERYDAIVEMNNPGLFIFHDHVDSHMTNNGKDPGGPITIIEYDGVKRPDFYIWKDKEYDANFFYSESMRRGYGLFEWSGFKGKGR